MRPIFCPNGFINFAIEDTRKDTKQVMVVGNSLKIFVQATIYGIMNLILSQEDTADGIHA